MNDTGLAWTPVGSDPSAMAYDSGTNTMFVTNSASGNVSVVAANTYAIVGNVSVGAGPSAALYVGAVGSVYVANAGGGTVSVINSTTLKVVTSVAVGQGPDALAFDPSTGDLYVANQLSDNFTVIGTSNNVVSGSVALESGAMPNALTYDPTTGYIFSANGDGNLGVLIPSSNSYHAVPVGSAMTGITLNTSADTLFLSDGVGRAVDAVSASSTTVLHTTPLGPGDAPNDIVYDGVTGRVFASNGDPNGALNVTVIDAAGYQTLGTVAVYNAPYPVAFGSATNFAYVYDGGSGTVYALNVSTGSVVGWLFVGYTRAPAQTLIPGLAYDVATNSLWVSTNFQFGSSNHVYEITATVPMTLQATVTVGTAPAGIAYDSGTQTIYVANSGSDNVSVIDPSSASVTATIAVGSVPAGIAYDSNNGNIYVANLDSNTLSVISGTTNSVVATLPTGTAPVAVTVAPPDHRVYVGAAVSGNLTAFNDTTNKAVQSVYLNGATPRGLAYNTVNGTVLVSSSPGVAGSGTVGIFDAGNGTFVQNLSVSDDPSGIAYDPTTNYAIVANYGSGSVAVLGVTSAKFFPVFVTLSVAPPTAAVNSSVHFHASAQGGLPWVLPSGHGYTWSWSGVPAGTGCVTPTTQNISSFFCDPNTVGNYTVTVTVSDSLGTTNSSAAKLSVIPKLLPVKVTLTIAPNPVLVNSVINLTANATGGTDVYDFAYSGLPTGCSTENASSYHCTPTAVGTYMVTVNVTALDTNESLIGTDTVKLVIESSIPPPNNQGGSAAANSTLVTWIVIGAAIVVVALAVALIMRRGRKSASTPPPATSSVPGSPPASPPPGLPPSG